MSKGRACFGHLSLEFKFACIIILLLQLTHQIASGDVANSSPKSQIARPDCPEKCGDVSIPYPFGIGDDCYYRDPLDTATFAFYNITCNKSRDPIVPTYGLNIEVVNITLDGEFWVRNYISTLCYDDQGNIPFNFTTWISIPRFALSATNNIAGGIGCGTLAFFYGTRMKSSNSFATGCYTACFDQSEAGNTCSGIGCCQASIPEGINYITLNVTSINQQNMMPKFNPCSVAFVGAKNHVETETMLSSVKSILTKDADSLRSISLPIVYDWAIGTKDCEAAKAAKEYICQENTTCENSPAAEWGYRCKCKAGFQDIDECANSSDNNCEKPNYCINESGSFRCQCPEGYNGNGTKDSNCISNSDDGRQKLLFAIKIIICVSGGIIVSLIVAFWFNWQYGNKKLQKLRKTFFLQNGGHILLQKLSERDVALGNMVRMFSAEELKKATNNYSEKSIIGRGGFGMVFKGILPNNQIVAIKKSLRVDSSQVEQFINEVVALSQINNIHVVKLLGCCLENEVPLLVYEFISNGTLYEHLHDEGNTRLLSWGVRLRVAAQVAEVLAYLHTTISIPIIHRDIKSANILLDDNCTAKVADFGASKLAPVDQEQLATMVQGTCGYLDPEYMQTGELTDKSDVYSFGVVLAELLTREKAISYAKPEKDRSLAIYFLRKVKEYRLFEILDKNIVSDETIEQINEVANLAKRCLKLKGEDRPTMKEVERELARIMEMMHVHPWSHNEVFQEEGEHLLHETREVNINFASENGNDPLSNQTKVVQLVPMNDGR